jgi:hypothetical protein
MTARRAQAAWERLLAGALRAPDPVLALRRGARSLPRNLARTIAAADADGIRMTALLVASLRFHRLLCACPRAAAWFEADPAGFASAFRRYHAEVRPRAFFPPGEARAFLRWLGAASTQATSAQPGSPD